MGLREARLKRRLTTTALARKSGVSQPAIAMLERLRDPNPTWRIAAKLCLALDMEPWDVFGTPKKPRRTAAA